MGRVLIRYKGLLATGDTFDQGEADFVLGENKVIAGWEEGFTGQCAGEKITMIVPPTLGYGAQASDKVPANSTLYFLTTLDGIVRVTKAPPGGDCNEGVKARPGQDVTMKIKAKVSQPDGRGKIFFDKPSFELWQAQCKNIGSWPREDSHRHMHGREAPSPSWSLPCIWVDWKQKRISASKLDSPR